jgi:hypothetical protein
MCPFLLHALANEDSKQRDISVAQLVQNNGLFILQSFELNIKTWIL